MCFQCQNHHKRNVAHFLYSWLCLCPLLCVFSPVFAVLATFFDNVQVEYLLADTIQFGKRCEADTKAQTVRFQCQNDHKRNVDHFLCSWLCLYLFSPVVLLCKYRSTAAWFLETSFDHMQVRHRPNWKALRHRFQGANDVLTVTNKIFGLHFYRRL